MGDTGCNIWGNMGKMGGVGEFKKTFREEREKRSDGRRIKVPLWSA